MEKERQLMSSMRNSNSVLTRDCVWKELQDETEDLLLDHDLEEDDLLDLSEIDKSIAELLIEAKSPINEHKVNQNSNFDFNLNEFNRTESDCSMKVASQVNNDSRTRGQESIRLESVGDNWSFSKPTDSNSKVEQQRVSRQSRPKTSKSIKSEQRVNCIVPIELRSKADCDASEKNKMYEYREELKQQIKEKKRMLEEEKRRMQEEDERLERRLEQQRKRIAAELEIERRKNENRQKVMNERQNRAKAYLAKERNKKGKDKKVKVKKDNKSNCGRVSIRIESDSDPESVNIKQSFLHVRVPQPKSTLFKNQFQMNRINLNDEF